MVWFFVISVVVVSVIIGLLLSASGHNYQSDYDPSSPHDLFFNPVLQELKNRDKK